MNLIILSAISYLLSLLTVGFIRQRFSRQLLDVPNERSSHVQPTPRGGGLGFIVAFAVTGLLACNFPNEFPQLTRATPLATLPELSCPGFVAMGLILSPLAIAGLLDDWRSIAAQWRYLVQMIAASIAVICFGPFPQPWLTSLGLWGELTAIALTVIGMTALINFYNFMDGLDGLVAGVTAVQLSFLAVFLNQPYLWLLVAALLGFLGWNWSPAKIFMGDVGSTVLGAMVAIALLRGSTGSTQAWSALVITFPLLADAIYTLFRRLLRQENIFQAHRSHLYQRLQQSGWSHRTVAGVYIGLTLLIAGLVNFLDEAGVWLGLASTAGSVVGGEVYLQRRRYSRSSDFPSL